ncbi:MAG: Lrp/AsnC family transcriptional regulator [Actinomyces sp.]|nr:MAG: Lrp/AsnC family transcriptional regulator [Actinomyces sp.]
MPSRRLELDVIDRRLLNALQADGRLTNAQLAEHVGLSPSAVHRRVRRLEEAGVIAGHALLVDKAAIGRPLDVFVEISLVSQSVERLSAFEAAVADCPEVMSCHLMAGEADYLLHLSVADTADFERIHAAHLSRLPGVARIKSNFAMRTVHETTVHHLDETP